MKIIVAGAGEIGSHLAKMLSMEFHEITVISPNEEDLERISSESDIVTVEGHPASIETLQKAGVQNADLFIAVNPDNEQDINIVSSILATKLGAKKVTARINNDEYQKNENRILFTDLGIDSLFYPEKIAAKQPGSVPPAFPGATFPLPAGYRCCPPLRMHCAIRRGAI